jgi:hypothetical protein
MIQTMKNRFGLTLLLASILLLTAGVWNGFPFLYPDDGTYFSSGFMPEMPLDRPITYGLFIYATSLGGWSMWGTIGVQGLMTAWVIYQVLKAYFDSQNIDFQFIAIVLLLVLTSSISFLTSQLMPDFSTPVLLLSQLLLVSDTPLSKNTRRGLFAIFFLTTAMHIGHLVFNILLLSLFLILYFFAKKKLPFLKIKTIGMLAALTLLSLGTMSAPLAKSSHAFRMGAMAHKGILQKVLDKKCPEKYWRLCQFRDSMPTSLEGFLWSANSPLHKIGLLESKKEFNDIIWTSYTTPDLLKLHIEESIKATKKQFGLYSVCEGNAPFKQGSIVYDEIQKVCPSAIPSFEGSRQAKNEIEAVTNTFNFYLNYIVVFLFFGSFILLINKTLWSVMHRKLRFFLTFILIGLLLNAWLNATLVYASNRYGTKMIWLIHLAFFLILMTFYDKKNRNTDVVQP